MSGINKVVLVGRIGKDPDIRFMQSGGKLANFSLATSESWLDKNTNERKEITQWHRVVVYNENLADIVEKYVKKGTLLYLEGSLTYRKYVDSNGIERNISEIVINRFKGEIQILSSKEEGSMSATTTKSDTPNKEAATSYQDNSSDNLANNLDDDIPF